MSLTKLQGTLFFHVMASYVIKIYDFEDAYCVIQLLFVCQKYSQYSLRNYMKTLYASNQKTHYLHNPTYCYAFLVLLS